MQQHGQNSTITTQKLYASMHHFKQFYDYTSELFATYVAREMSCD